MKQNIVIILMIFAIAPIVKALKREIPVRIHAHRADDIISALRFAEEFNLDLRIEHCTEGHFIADELAGLGFKSFSWTYSYKKIES